jgi:hypothetical protein
VQVVGIKTDSDGRAGADFSASEVQQFQELAQTKNLYDKISQVVRLFLLCSFFGFSHYTCFFFLIFFFSPFFLFFFFFVVVVVVYRLSSCLLLSSTTSHSHPEHCACHLRPCGH